MRSGGVVFIVCLLVSFIHIKEVNAANCGLYTAKDGSKYDLTALTK